MNIGDSIEIIVNRDESHFDRACDSAYQRAVLLFGIDENGHSKRVKDWERSCCWIEIEFIRYKRIGSDHCYIFMAKTAKNEDE